jgi:hypothetical protein
MEDVTKSFYNHHDRQNVKEILLYWHIMPKTSGEDENASLMFKRGVKIRK